MAEGELDKLLKCKKRSMEKVYLSMWMEGNNLKLSSKKNEGKFQINITPRDGDIYHLLKAFWNYETT